MSDLERAIAEANARIGLTAGDTVTISRRRAVELASALITRITEMRRDRWAALIADRKNARGRARLWMPWLRCLSSEEIRRRESQEYPNPDHFGSYHFQKAQAVLRMASVVDDGECVTLSADTLACISLFQ